MEPKDDPRISLVMNISKAQPILLGLTLIGFVGIMQRYPYSNIALLIGAGALVMFYFMKAQYYIDLEWTSADRMIHRFSFYGLALGMVAFIFHLTRTPGWDFLSLVSIMIFSVIFLLLVRKKGAITKYLSMIELSAMVLIFVYFGRVYMAQL